MEIDISWYRNALNSPLVTKMSHKYSNKYNYNFTLKQSCKQVFNNKGQRKKSIRFDCFLCNYFNSLRIVVSVAHR